MHCSAGQFIEESLISVTLYQPANLPKTESRFLVDDQNHLHTAKGLHFYPQSVIEGYDTCPERKNSPATHPRKVDPTLYRTLSSDPPPECKVTAVNAWHAWDEGYKHFARQEYSAALSCYERAAAEGNADAALEIGSLYDHGFGVGKDLPLAMQWYRVASDAGNSVAAQRLSTLWFRGEGIEHNQSEVVNFEERAYCLGESEAAFSAHIHYLRGQPGPAPAPADQELWRLRHLAELGKAQPICELPDVRAQMSSLLTRMSLRSLVSSNDTESLSGLIGLLPNPATGDPRAVIGVRAIQRHGEGEVECEGMFSTAPTEWSFKVNRVPNTTHPYLVTAATGTQWFALLNYRTALSLAGAPPTIIGMHNLYDVEVRTGDERVAGATPPVASAPATPAARVPTRTPESPPPSPAPAPIPSQTQAPTPLLPQTSTPSSLTELERRANGIVLSMASGDFKAVTDRYTEGLTRLVVNRRNLPTPDALSSTWQRLIDAFGPFENIMEVHQEQGRYPEIVFLVCKFKNGSVNIEVVFGPNPARKTCNLVLQGAPGRKWPPGTPTNCL
ncbi:MAG TPA: hypothetical protein VKZ53_09395 [Candidatus Angelobacter sp.]|nr:hypothetical protein [Candidatus Angelobacter sp.]